MVKDRNEKLADVLLSRADVELILEALENYVPRTHTTKAYLVRGDGIDTVKVQMDGRTYGMELISFMARHQRSLQRDNMGV